MVTPSPGEIARRIRALLPGRWFADETPVLDVLLSGLGVVWTELFTMLATVRVQTRIATATGTYLDLIAWDFFGARLGRGRSQSDDAFRSTIRRELLRNRATRNALEAIITDLTGHRPTIFEPTRPQDTGGWNIATGYGVAGKWGSLALPFQCFVDVIPPQGIGISQVAGWNIGGAWGAGRIDAIHMNLSQSATTGPLEYANLSMLNGQLSSADINSAIAAVLPAGAIAWVRIGV